MKSAFRAGLVGVSAALFLLLRAATAQDRVVLPDTGEFPAVGTITRIEPDTGELVIAHEAITNYMAAMTMPFHVKQPGVLKELKAGDRIAFHLHVTADASWIDGINRLGVAEGAEVAEGVNVAGGVNAAGLAPPVQPAPESLPESPRNPLLNFAFTNELGQPMRLSDFKGQALAVTFFFTRCPIPEYCPRLSKNFQTAAMELASMAHAPTNWHFLSITFDPEHDTPEVLKTYARRYAYDPRHWNFLTGPADKIRELARACDVTASPDSGLFNHNFRTLIVDAEGHLQMVFPTSGDLSEPIVNEMLKAAAPSHGTPVAHR